MKPCCFRAALQIFASAGALLVVVGCQSNSQTASHASAVRVAEVKGNARCADAGQPWRKLSTGDPLAPGSLIQTAAASSVDIAFEGAGGPSPRMLLQSDTVLFIEGLPGAFVAGVGADGKNLRMELRLGSLTFASPMSDRGPACEIRFTNGLAEARQATFDLRSDGQLIVRRGTVAMKLVGGQPPMIVAAGNQYDPQTGKLTQLPTEPVNVQPIRTTAVRPPTQPWLPVPMRKY